MARKEAALDLWVADRLTECDIEFTSLGSSIKKSTTPSRTHPSAERETLAILNICKPGIALFLLFIEDKASQSRHEMLSIDSGILDMSTECFY